MAGLTEAQKSDILLESWIGPRYRKMKFSMLGDGYEALFKMANDKSSDFLHDGRSLFVHGAGAKDAAMVLGSALAYRGVGVRAVHLSKLSDALDTFNEEVTGPLMDADTVVLHGFFDRGVKTCPLADRSRFRIEWFLSERFALEKSVVIASDSPANLIGAWWPEAVRDLIQNHYEACQFSKAVTRILEG